MLSFSKNQNRSFGKTKRKNNKSYKGFWFETFAYSKFINHFLFRQEGNSGGGQNPSRFGHTTGDHHRMKQSFPLSGRLPLQTPFSILSSVLPQRGQTLSILSRPVSIKRLLEPVSTDSSLNPKFSCSDMTSSFVMSKIKTPPQWRLLKELFGNFCETSKNNRRYEWRIGVATNCLNSFAWKKLTIKYSCLSNNQRQKQGGNTLHFRPLDPSFLLLGIQRHFLIYRFLPPFFSLFQKLLISQNKIRRIFITSTFSLSHDLSPF